MTLSLTEDSFIFNYSALSSYIPVGTYNIKNGKLICTADNGEYTYCFNITYSDKDSLSASRFSTLQFDAENSSPIPKYRYSTDSSESVSPVADGSIFKYTQGRFNYNAPTLLAETDWDIDGDGIKEHCTVRIKPSTISSAYEITFTAEQETEDNGISEIEYRSDFQVPSINITLEHDKDGGCVMNLLDPKTASELLTAYQIKFSEGEITLKELK